ncbi:MAG: hypothetical protein ACLFU1_06140 [Alphaproteobacteria bacterium]
MNQGSAHAFSISRDGASTEGRREGHADSAPSEAQPPAFTKDDLGALDALNDFLERPHHVGLDSLKHSLSKGVTLMMELLGEDEAFIPHHLAYETEPAMAVANTSRKDRAKRRKEEEFYLWFLAIERLMREQMAAIFSSVFVRIEEVSQSIEEQIVSLNQQIASGRGDVEEAQEKRTVFKSFLERLKERRQQLEEAKAPEEMLEVGEALEEDVDALENGRFDPLKNKARDVAAFFSGLLARARAGQPAVVDSDESALLYDEPDYYNPYNDPFDDPYDTLEAEAEEEDAAMTDDADDGPA